MKILLFDKRSPGRPKEYEDLIDVHIKLPKIMVEEVENVAGERKKSNFIRIAVDYYLKHKDRIMKEQKEKETAENWTDNDSKEFLDYLEYLVKLDTIHDNIYKVIKMYLGYIKEYNDNEYKKIESLKKVIEKLKTNNLIDYADFTISQKLNERKETRELFHKMCNVVSENTL